MIILFVWIDDDSGGGGGSGPSDPGGTGWGGGITPVDNDVALTVYTWEKDPSVTFNTMHEMIWVDPRSYAQNTSGAEDCADDISAEIASVQGAGGKAGLFFWFPDQFDGDSPLFSDWFDELSSYEAIPVGTGRQAWWDDFKDQMISNGATADFKIHDLERGVNYFQIPLQADRQRFFENITIDDGNNTYPNSPNPYIGANIWRFGDPLTDQFLQEYNQWACEARVDFIKAIHEDIPVATVGGNQNFSNYGDQLLSFNLENLRGRSARQPPEQDRLSDISSPHMYLDYNPVHVLTEPEVNYASEREQINRRRWKTMIHRLNQARSCVGAEDNRLVPWIAPPGYGAQGSDTWCSSTILPFEKILWRIKMRHLLALGVDTFILWNPTSNNPNSADTDEFCDAYFTDMYKRQGLSTSLSPIAYSSNVLTTNDRVTAYQDVYELGMIYYARATSPIEPFSQGFCTEEEPLIINTGATGNAELAALQTALETVYGPSNAVPPTSDVGGFEPLPE